MSAASVQLGSFIHTDDAGLQHITLMIEGIHCPSCVAIIERTLRAEADVHSARLNLSTRRLNVAWSGKLQRAQELIALLERMGYRAIPFDTRTQQSSEHTQHRYLLRCLAVAGFASGNLMLFSVPLWSGGNEMGEATRAMFHWLQALISIPAVAYAGRPFFASAWEALSHKRTNMDVPISLAIVLATLMSLFELITQGTHAYFDSAVMLLFFLLIGRYLEARARGEARRAASDLLARLQGFATIRLPDGGQKTVPFSDLQPGMLQLVASGEALGADGVVHEGISQFDNSMITGETLPQEAHVGTKLFAGMVNMGGAIVVEIMTPPERSLMAEMVALMEKAEQGQARYVALADRISRWYTPLVHALALGAFLYWFGVAGMAWQQSLLIAATVLIITCPCALGLAVPVVQMLACGQLMRRGILLKSASALERLASMNHVVFDKTGTLTLGKPAVQNMHEIDPETLYYAASLAASSRHPLARAVSAAYEGALLPLHATEVAGCGVEALMDGVRLRLGKHSWAAPQADAPHDDAMELWCSIGEANVQRFIFTDALRSDALPTVNALKHFPITLLSGDRPSVVKTIARALGITDARAQQSPKEKCEALSALQASGARVFMVGDGLNDAPCLASAHVSMSPSTAMDITQNAADIVFQGDSLAPVAIAWRTACRAQQLVKENFTLAMLYNVVAVPLALIGEVTPLIAALAMSSSSLLVMLNAMRLRLEPRPKE